MRRVIVFLTIGILLIVSCSPAPTPEFRRATPTPRPTATAVPTPAPTAVLPPCTVTSVQSLTTANNPYPRDFPQPAYMITSQVPVSGTVPLLFENGRQMLPPGAPASTLYQISPQLRPQADWISYVGEMANHPSSHATGAGGEYEQHNGYWGDLWVVKPDGTDWTNLTDYVLPTVVTAPVGTLNPYWSPDGQRLAWASLVGLPTATHALGQWQIKVATFAVDANGVPSLTNIQDATPPNGNWNEVLGWSPNSEMLLVSSDSGMPYDYGADDWVVDVDGSTFGAAHDITNQPLLWDEHAAWSPHGNAILYLQQNPPASLPGSANEPYPQWRPQLFTNYWLSLSDGSVPVQVTQFTGSSGGDPIWNSDGSQVIVPAVVINGATGLPSSETNWLVTFSGICG